MDINIKKGDELIYWKTKGQYEEYKLYHYALVSDKVANYIITATKDITITPDDAIGVLGFGTTYVVILGENYKHKYVDMNDGIIETVLYAYGVVQK